MSWAKRRQLLYGSITILFMLIVIGVPVYFKFFNAAPTCFDGKQDGDEQGVDCGGSCAIACTDQVTPDPVVLWSRPFVVANGLTNLVAYVQNPNINYVSKNVPYLFRVYDKNNVLIGTREGVMDIPPIKTFAVFEPAFNSGQRVPATAFFDFTAPLVWQKFNDTKPEFDVSDTLLLDASSTPHITATLNNDTINKYRDVEVVVIVYDDQGNAQASSRTVVDEIDPSGSAPLTFTWPSPFDFTMSKIEIIPKLPLGQ